MIAEDIVDAAAARALQNAAIIAGRTQDPVLKKRRLQALVTFVARINLARAAHESGDAKRIERALKRCSQAQGRIEILFKE